MSQLAVESIYLVVANFLIEVICSQRDEAEVKRLVNHIANVHDFEDKSPLGAYGLGALTTKLGQSSSEPRSRIDEAIFTHGPMSSSNATHFLLGAIENMDLIQWSDSLEKLSGSSDIIKEKLYAKFPSLHSSSKIPTCSTAGILSCDNIDTWIEDLNPRHGLVIIEFWSYAVSIKK